MINSPRPIVTNAHPQGKDYSGLNPKKVTPALCIAAYQHITGGQHIHLSRICNEYRITYPSDTSEQHGTQIFGEECGIGTIMTLTEIATALNKFASQLDLRHQGTSYLKMLDDMQKNAARFPTSAVL